MALVTVLKELQDSEGDGKKKRKKKINKEYGLWRSNGVGGYIYINNP